MDWKVLTDEAEVNDIIKRSESRPQVIFKHSTRCSISTVAKGRLERSQVPPGADFYYLDIFNYRNISNRISQQFNIHHESPQVLVIKDGASIYDESHMGINMGDIQEAVERVT